jgi:hypothetical protein
VDKNERSAPDVLRECYSNLPVLRASFQAIPWLGGSIDTLIVGRTAQIQMARVEDYIRLLTLRMERVERVTANLNGEEFSDLVLSTFQEVARTRSAAKREHFAAILARQAERNLRWEDANAAVRLLADLTEVHLAILAAALHAPDMGKPFEGLRVITPVANRKKFRSELEERAADPLYLSKALPGFAPLALKMGCVDLLSRGLLHDEGIGRWGTVNLEFLVPTELAEWFAAWITEGSDAP